MDKLTRYNQKLLAIIGTIAILGLVAFLLIGSGILIYTFFDRPTTQEEGLQVRQGTKNPGEVALRTQQVSFTSPTLLDSAQSLFLIPVGQVNSEYKVEGDLVTEALGSGSYRYNERFESYTGLFNNFILFENKTDQKTRIFNKKAVLTDWANVKIKDTELLLFIGTSLDSNQDHLLDSEDMQSLFAYYLKDKKLIEYNLRNQTVLNYNPLKNTNLIGIELGVDKNRDNTFDRKTEPTNIVSLNTQSRLIQDLVPAPLKNEIQSLIDQ